MDKILTGPLSRAAIKRQFDKNGAVEGTVAINLSEIIGQSFERFLDLLSERLVGNDLLMETSYSIVGHDGDTLHIKVSGNPSMILEGR